MKTLDREASASDLAVVLREAANAYYNGGTSAYSDAEYDTLVDLLREKDPKHPFLKTVGAPPVTGKVFKHAYPVGSQEKLKSFDEVQDWCAKVDCLYVHNEAYAPFIVQWKLDGITAVLTYKNGKLVRALTRGDGEQGEDITRNVKLMRNVKEELPGFSGVLRGEIVLPISRFDEHFKPLGFKNPRNTVAGKTRDEKATPDVLKHLEIIYFDLFPMIDWEEGCAAFFGAHGLDYVDWETARDSDQVWEAYQSFEKRRPNYDIDVDGVVVRANSCAVQKAMGLSSDNRPKGQKCIKFQAAGAITTILDVVHSVGHTGEIYPTAKVAPVTVCGVTISSCTLHNYEEVRRLGVAIGDRVEIIRAGDVIPKIVKLVSKAKNRVEIKPPLKCPACGWSTVQDGQHILCEHTDCEGQKLRRIKTWVKKRDIKYWGDEVLQALFDAKLVDTPYDLYFLQQQQVRELKMGGRVVGGAADRMFVELEKSKTSTLTEFIGSLGLDGLGRREAELMVSACDLEDVQDFLNLTEERLSDAHGYGDVSAKKIVGSLKRGKPLIERMLEVITIEEPVEETKPVAMQKTKATGKTFCFTGALPSGQTRAGAEADLFNAGGIAMDSVKAGLDYLVIADPDSTSSKAVKARKLGIQIISETQFRNLIR